ncbi:hypothetical protein M5K25_011035 [Dendrobium thyrsiflorum]|uniref:Uncharacterized protein n=1 Tax=Dendrobium thyrsiflorum TaxID=117978 RepID=A0ABD0V185_DENTH
MSEVGSSSSTLFASKNQRKNYLCRVRKKTIKAKNIIESEALEQVKPKANRDFITPYTYPLFGGSPFHPLPFTKGREVVRMIRTLFLRQRTALPSFGREPQLPFSPLLGDGREPLFLPSAENRNFLFHHSLRTLFLRQRTALPSFDREPQLPFSPLLGDGREPSSSGREPLFLPSAENRSSFLRQRTALSTNWSLHTRLMRRREKERKKKDKTHLEKPHSPASNLQDSQQKQREETKAEQKIKSLATLRNHSHSIPTAATVQHTYRVRGGNVMTSIVSVACLSMHSLSHTTIN